MAWSAETGRNTVWGWRSGGERRFAPRSDTAHAHAHMAQTTLTMTRPQPKDRQVAARMRLRLPIAPWHVS